MPMRRLRAKKNFVGHLGIALPCEGIIMEVIVNRMSQPGQDR